MKYSLSNTINRPLDDVIAKFKDPDTAKYWVEGLQRIEPLSGTPGEAGAVSDIHFLYKGKEMVIKETILEQNFPHQIKFAYESKMGYNEVEMQFEALEDNLTKQMNNSYFELKGFMKLMGFFAKGAFKKQSLKYMDAFKKFCEEGPPA